MEERVYLPHEIEKVARVICDFEGRTEDRTIYGEAQWKRYVPLATVIWKALNGYPRDKIDVV